MDAHSENGEARSVEDETCQSSVEDETDVTVTDSEH